MEIARALGPMPFGWMIAMLILTIGVMYGVTRLVVYAGLTATAVTVCYLLNLPNSIYLIISGAMITLSGIILLIHFIQQNPVDEDIA